jgi:pimeloyl-ACP methyl ester carboxylesterase
MSPLLFALRFAAGPPPNLSGAWEGMLDAGVKLRLVIHLAQQKDGTLTATLDSVDQGAFGIPVASARASTAAPSRSTCRRSPAPTAASSTPTARASPASGSSRSPCRSSSSAPTSPPSCAGPQHPKPPFLRDRAQMQAAFAVLKSEADDATARKKLREQYDALSPEDKKKPENSEAAYKTQVETLLSPWFRQFLTLDPRPFLEKVTVPVLALNGAFDLQAPPEENLGGIKAALERAKNKDVTIRELPGLNHLFQHAKTGAPGEYGVIEESFAPEALAAISEWVAARAK